MNDAAMVEGLVMKNMKLPAYMVERYCTRYLGYCEFEELVAVGNVGLVKAAQRFDGTRGIQFTTYACSIIHGEILKFIRDSIDLLSFSRPTKELYHAIHKKGLGSLDVREAAKVMKVSEERVKGAFEYARYRYAASLSEVVCSSGEGEPITVGDCIRSYEDFESPVMYSEIFELLDQQERIVFIGRYIERVTRAELIKRLGLSWRVYERIARRVSDKVKRYFRPEQKDDCLAGWGS
jgi:DNA-directed RNA polymerase specialized sigma subunit